MTRGELVKLIDETMRLYRANGILDSVKRNSHMNEYKNEKVSQKTLDAIMVDFVNFVASTQGIDYALYTSDLPSVVMPQENVQPLNDDDVVI